MTAYTSRRKLGRQFAAAAVGTALFSRVSADTSARDKQQLTRLLQAHSDRFAGTLIFDGGARKAAAEDFGSIIHCSPLAVLKPRSVADIVDLVKFANGCGLRIAIRGAGHAMYGDSQVEGGLVIDSHALNSVRVLPSPRGRVLEVGAGALWDSVWQTAYAEQLTPPVNVDTGILSVGGTISTGGFGGTTWREGLQVDHVLELQVVTGGGDLVTCSETRNRELFSAMLAGMGQCGIIVKVIMRLVAAPTHVLFYVLSYEDLPAATADLVKLVNDGRFSYLDCRTVPRQGAGSLTTWKRGLSMTCPTLPWSQHYSPN